MSHKITLKCSCGMRDCTSKLVLHESPIKSGLFSWVTLKGPDVILDKDDLIALREWIDSQLNREEVVINS